MWPCSWAWIPWAAPGKRWFSSLIHTSHYFGGYLAASAIFAPFLFLGAAFIRKTPAARGWWLVLRAIGFILGALMTGVYGMFMMMYGPYSPLIFLIILATGVMLYRPTRKLIGNLRFGFARS